MVGVQNAAFAAMETEKKGFEGEEMIRDRFLFFENFKTTADKLPDDLRLKFYDALTDYVFNEVEPDDAIIAALINAIKPSLNKEDGRANNGGKRENAGRKSQQIEKEKSNLINSNQSFSNNNQSFQFLSETETRNGNKKQEDNIPPSEDKSSSVGIFSADAPKKYAFEGKVIRLNQKDFDSWQRAYPDLNLYAECLQRDAYLAKQPPDEQKNWFVSTGAYFIKQNAYRKAQNSNLEQPKDPDYGDYL